LNKQDLNALLLNYFFKPFCDKKTKHVGVEIELPIVNLQGFCVCEKTLQKMMLSLLQTFAFQVLKQDVLGNIISIVNSSNNDIIAFEYSMYSLELSLGTDTNLKDSARRAYTYIEHIQNLLMPHNHTLTGLGIHPHANNIPLKPLNYFYYHMLHHYMRVFDINNGAYLQDFFAITNSVQMHIDCDLEQIPETLMFFSQIDWINAMLFANSSWLVNQKKSCNDCVCCRDILYQNSPFGVVYNNLGVYDKHFNNCEEVLLELSNQTLWRIKYDDGYVFFASIPIKDYFISSSINGYHIDQNFNVKKITFTPKAEHINGFKSFKNIAFSHRGTLELRSNCQQPMSKIFAPLAFALGCLVNKNKIAHHMQNFMIGQSNNNLRQKVVLGKIHDIFSVHALSELLIKIVGLAYDGLTQRGFGEECFIEHLLASSNNLICPAKQNLEFLRTHGDINQLILHNAKFNRL